MLLLLHRPPCYECKLLDCCYAASNSCVNRRTKIYSHSFTVNTVLLLSSCGRVACWTSTSVSLPLHWTELSGSDLHRPCRWPVCPLGNGDWKSPHLCHPHCWRLPGNCWSFISFLTPAQTALPSQGKSQRSWFDVIWTKAVVISSPRVRINRDTILESLFLCCYYSLALLGGIHSLCYPMPCSEAQLIQAINSVEK